jgi:hypothetical protein
LKLDSNQNGAIIGILEAMMVGNGAAIFKVLQSEPNVTNPLG